MAKQQKRNLHACAPIMRKGGIHEKSTKAKRAKDKQAMKRMFKERSDRSFFCLSVLFPACSV